MYEEAQKINMLAAELFRQGIASTRDDALKKAQEMVARQSKSSQTDISSVYPAQQEQPRSMNYNDPMEVAQRDKKYMEREIARFNGILESFSKEIISVREEIKGLKETISLLKSQVQQAGAVRKQENSQQQLNQIQQSSQNAQQRQEQQTSHPRSGNYKPEEVAVDKFFYFGSKR